MIGILSLAAAMALVASRRRGPSIDAFARRSACRVSIVLLAPRRGDRESLLIDRATGGHGFSHAVIDGCESDEIGRPVVIDCRLGSGVVRRPWVDYEGRKASRVWLPTVDGAEAYGCARGRIGVPYDLLGLAFPSSGPRSGLVCSQLVTECLPARLRAQIHPMRRVVAPNDIARAFGITAPGQHAEVA
jgi:hypothetical protein